MTCRFWLIMLLTGFALGAAPLLSAATLAERLLTSYDAVQTLTCEIRRDTEAGGKRVRFLSRIAYARPDRLNVENVEPVALPAPVRKCSFPGGLKMRGEKEAPGLDRSHG